MVFVYVGRLILMWDGRSVYVYVFYVCFKGIGIYVAFFSLACERNIYVYVCGVENDSLF